MVAAAAVKGIVQLSEDSFQNCNSASVDDNNNNNDDDDCDKDDNNNNDDEEDSDHDDNNDDFDDNFVTVYDNTGVSKKLHNKVFFL